MPINTVIFDLGNVIIPLHRDKMIQQFTELGAKNVAEVIKQEKFTQTYLTYENGSPTTDFRTALRTMLSIPHDKKDDEIDQAWNSMLGEIPAERFKMIKELRQSDKKVILLSNTNAIHYDFLQKKYGVEFKACFTKEYFSHHLKMSKPSTAIYQHVIHDNKLNPNETYFFDDKLENVDSARDVGILAKQVNIDTPNTAILEALNKIKKEEKDKTIKDIGVVAGIAALALAGLFAVNHVRQIGSSPDNPNFKP